MPRPVRNKKVNQRVSNVEKRSPEGALIDGSVVAMDMMRNELNRHAGTMGEGDSFDGNDEGCRDCILYTLNPASWTMFERRCVL